MIRLLDLYGVAEPRRGDLLTLPRESAQRGWLRQYRDELPEVYTDYISLEDDARSISNYESLLIPGLLQTEAYLRAHFRGRAKGHALDGVRRNAAILSLLAGVLASPGPGIRCPPQE